MGKALFFFCMPGILEEGRAFLCAATQTDETGEAIHRHPATGADIDFLLLTSSQQLRRQTRSLHCSTMCISLSSAFCCSVKGIVSTCKVCTYIHANIFSVLTFIWLSLSHKHPLSHTHTNTSASCLITRGVYSGN